MPCQTFQRTTGKQWLNSQVQVNMEISDNNVYGIVHTCIAITPKRMPHAIPTRMRASTIAQHANWLMRFKNINMLAKNHPHDHVSSMKQHWADHCSHIRSPSSMNVLTRHRRATGKRTCLPCRSTYSIKDSVWILLKYIHFTNIFHSPNHTK